MPVPILATKLFIPAPRTKLIHRPQLIECMNEGMHRKLTLISAPAGFGKTTLVSEWVEGCERQVAWLSLDEGDNDVIRFLIYFVAAIQTVVTNMGEGVMGLLQSPQIPPIEAILTTLLNEITTISENITFVLDDYHAVDAKSVDDALSFLLDHMPPKLHLVIASREDPHIPLARLRAQNQLTELRAADLRFSPSEASAFLNHVMALNLSDKEIVALETRTEGWIAGLQLAAISMKGYKDYAGFIKAFTGSHNFVLDYLAEEVLLQQPENVQNFLLCTSILDRMCGPLCDAVLLDSSASGQKTLEYLEHSNLFIVPLDNERHWYRYHHLFSDLLRQRLNHYNSSYTGDEGKSITELHLRASRWYEANGLAIEAFQHAATANDIECAERLIESKGMPMQFHAVVSVILKWLSTLPEILLNERPSLWVRYGAMLLIAGQTTGVEEKLKAAEAALQGAEQDTKTQNLIGQIAAARATLALTQYNVEAIITQSRRALEYLHPDSLPFRTTAIWALGYAYQLKGERTAAVKAYNEAISISKTTGDAFIIILATTGLGLIQESENQIYLATETYKCILQWLGDHPQPHACEVYNGLARISYEWNDLDAAQRYGQLSFQMAQLYENVIDRIVLCEVLLARLKLAQGDVTGATAMLAKSDQSARQKNFIHRLPEIAAVQVITMLRQGDVTAAAHLAESHTLPLSQARVHLAKGDVSAALAILEPLHLQAIAKDWKDEQLKVMILKAVALYANSEKEMALIVLGDALVMAEPGGFIRIFIDEGIIMQKLLSEAYDQGIMPEYTGKLLAAFRVGEQKNENNAHMTIYQQIIEPLSQRELDILRLISQGLSNQDISKKLFLALDTVKGHNRRIFDKLQVQRRTEAVARARELGLF